MNKVNAEISNIVIFLVIAAIAFGGYIYFTGTSGKSVEVSNFYDGSEGYSLSIPTGNTSTCVWTYAGGNASVPYTDTTFARSATDKHTIYSRDYFDWKVTCVDDFGARYVGVFPNK